MKRKGFLSGFLGTILVLIGVVVLMVLTSLLANLVFSARLAGLTAVAILKLSVTGAIVYFILLEIIFFMWQISLAKKEDKNQSDEDKKKFSKICRAVYIGVSCAIVLFAVISVNTYTDCREDSISEKFFVTVKEYKWANVRSYSLVCDEYGALDFNVTMKNGKTFEILNTVTSCSDEFLQKYENMYGYAAYLSDEFDSHESYIEKRIVHADYAEAYYKEQYPEVWKYLKTIIGEENLKGDGSPSQSDGEQTSDNTESTDLQTEAVTD